MTQKSFVQNFLIRIASALAAVFLVLGLILIFAARFSGEPTSGVGLLVIAFAVVTAVLSLAATNFSMLSLNAEIKEAAFTADKIAQGEIFYNLEDDDDSDLKLALRRISENLAEKTRVAERIALNDLSADVVPHSESDVFGQAFQNMIVKLRAAVQTEEQRDRLQKSIQKLLTEMSEVAAGDLNRQAEVSSEATGAVAKAFNSMTKELRASFKQIRDASLQVSASAGSINETTEQLARGSEAQTSQIVRTTAAISQMAAQIQEVSDNASLSAQVAGDSLSNARYGTKAAQDIIGAMNSIRNQVQETAKRIKRLGERSQEISQIVSLIDDLSDRTGILALNASLQAAAAGESGRGFAVVAEEVERLAERSNQLTQQIAALAQTIQIETKDVVASMEETIHEVVVGSTLADKAGQSLVEIEQVSGRLAELLQTISESARRQAQSSDDIAKAMANVSKVTELVHSGATRAADSVKILVALSDELRGAVAPFKLPEDKSARRKFAPESSGVYLN
jgi:twitching motility protein PilJ